MADRYIDYIEVSEYGRHFVNLAHTLIHASPLVDMAQLAAEVERAVEAVEAERTAASIERSQMRGGRGDITAATTHARDMLQRFFHYIRSLPRDIRLDVEALYPGRKLGKLSWLKPADVLARVRQVLRGLTVPANAGMPGLARWQEDLGAAHDRLDSALHGKSGRRTQASAATAALQARRDEFLQLYNGVAKPIVRGLLARLGRSNEYTLFFLDLRVHEGSRTRASAPPNSSTPA